MRKKLITFVLILSALGLVSILALKIPFISHKLDGPDFCGMCHVMDQWVDSYLQSSHKEDSTCGDCHIPHDYISGSFYKAFTGSRDAFYMVIGHTPDRIHISEHGALVVNGNCLDCHEGVMEEVGYPLAERDKNCFDCHRDLPHNRQLLQKGGKPIEQ